MHEQRPEGESAGPQLASAAASAAFLGRFFGSGWSAAGTAVEISDGLWSILSWCWSLRAGERRGSDLCHLLIEEPGLGWREETDVVEAIARRSASRNPSRLTPAAVETFTGALLREGERVRGRQPKLEVHLAFLLPRLDRHPCLDRDEIGAALIAAGTPESQVRQHLAAVHPERRPYQGTWILGIRERLAEAGGRTAAAAAEGRRPITILDAQMGARSYFSLCLAYATEFAGYFHLTLDSLERESVLPAGSSLLHNR